MKPLQVSIILTILTVAFLFSGFAAALNQDEASVHSFFSTTTLQPGQTVTVSVFFTSNSTDALTINDIGLHFDWMDSGGFFGFDLSSAPVTVPSGGTYMFNQISIQVPANVTLGDHTYYVGIDGTQGASSTAFSWNSPTLTVVVAGSSGQTTGPTVTVAPSGGGGQPSGQPNLLLYGAIGAVVVIIVLLVIVLLVRRKRTKPQPETNQPASQPETPKPEEKPSPEQDFNI
ncbi:MAG: hypothetical protein M1167_06865 [Chloroflexi bacterium]|nr:hypothetical protein [Chloroflexota bacterium]